MKIYKTVITLTVLHTGDLPHDLRYVLEEAEYGNAVGQETERVTTKLPDESVRAELLAIGNDGEFFSDDDGEMVEK